MHSRLVLVTGWCATRRRTCALDICRNPSLPARRVTRTPTAIPRAQRDREIVVDNVLVHEVVRERALEAVPSATPFT